MENIFTFRICSTRRRWGKEREIQWMVWEREIANDNAGNSNINVSGDDIVPSQRCPMGAIDCTFIVWYFEFLACDWDSAGSSGCRFVFHTREWSALGDLLWRFYASVSWTWLTGVLAEELRLKFLLALKALGGFKFLWANEIFLTINWLSLMRKALATKFSFMLHVGCPLKHRLSWIKLKFARGK